MHTIYLNARNEDHQQQPGGQPPPRPESRSSAGADEFRVQRLPIPRVVRDPFAILKKGQRRKQFEPSALETLLGICTRLAPPVITRSEVGAAVKIMMEV